MTVPARPKFQPQGPASNCVIGGDQLGWLSCTCYAAAMGIDKSTLGAKRPSGCSVRRQTGDTIGGTTLPQVAAVAEAMGVHVELHVGGNVGTPTMLAGDLHRGRGALVQGNTKALLGTVHQSTQGAVNHAVWANEPVGGTIFDPDSVFVYDPAADGRDRSYHVDQGPSVWPWSRLLAFAAALRPWGDFDPRVLGKGRVYYGAFPDTEPHVHLRFGGKRTKPFPDRMRADAKGDTVHVHSAPRTGSATVVGTLEDNELFVAWQVAQGDSFEGSKTWYGDHDGRNWVASKRLSHEGGTT